MEKLFDLFYNSSGVCTDTRKITKDCLFICLSGENFNGNTFAEKALELGAKYVISDEQNYCTKNEIHYVENSLIFLQNLANYHRNKFSFPIIGITGSNGKTSTKELIHCVLSRKYKTLATEGNLNNHIGVPLTILKINEKHEIAIVEMGANKFKDIEELCQIAEPTHGIITNIGKAHLEGFLDFEGVLKTKKELYQAVSDKKGVVFYNSDDAILSGNLPEQTETFDFGTNEHAKIIGELCSLTPFVNLKWKSQNHQSAEIETAMIGKYNFYNFLAAIAIGTYFKVDANDISIAIKEYQPSNNRSQVFKTEKNTLILDAYNANPSSMKSAIESFAMIEQSNKTAILGDMFELGKESESEHEIIINLVNQLGLKSYFIGDRFFEKAGLSTKEQKFFKSKDEFKKYLDVNPIENQLVILKGSRGIGLEQLVEKL